MSTEQAPLFYYGKETPETLRTVFEEKQKTIGETALSFCADGEPYEKYESAGDRRDPSVTRIEFSHPNPQEATTHPRIPIDHRRQFSHS